MVKLTHPSIVDEGTITTIFEDGISTHIFYSIKFKRPAEYIEVNFTISK